jgi:hypothetical protein
MATFGALEWGLFVLPWLGVLLALVLHLRDRTKGYPDRMKKMGEGE